MSNDLSRRDFVKTSVAAATAAAVGVPMAQAGPLPDLEMGLDWEKSVCRFWLRRGRRNPKRPGHRRQR